MFSEQFRDVRFVTLWHSWSMDNPSVKLKPRPFNFFLLYYSILHRLFCVEVGCSLCEGLFESLEESVGVVFYEWRGMFLYEFNVMWKSVSGKYGVWVGCGAVCVNENVVSQYVLTRSAMSIGARELNLTEFSFLLIFEQDGV